MKYLFKFPNIFLFAISVLVASFQLVIERVPQIGCTSEVPCFIGWFFERSMDDGYYIFGYYDKAYANWICWGNPITPIIALILFVAAFIPWNLIIKKVRVRHD